MAYTKSEFSQLSYAPGMARVVWKRATSSKGCFLCILHGLWKFGDSPLTKPDAHSYLGEILPPAKGQHESQVLLAPSTHKIYHLHWSRGSNKGSEPHCTRPGTISLEEDRSFSKELTICKQVYLPRLYMVLHWFSAQWSSSPIHKHFCKPQSELHFFSQTTGFCEDVHVLFGLFGELWLTVRTSYHRAQ